MDRIGQVAITINGECCPTQDSQAQGFNVRQVTFGIAGVGSGAPGFAEIDGGPPAVYDAAIDWLTKMRDRVADAGPQPETELLGPERSGAFKPDA